MKHVYLLLIVMIGLHPARAQDILYFFETIPDSSVMGLSREDRQKVVRYERSSNTGQVNHQGLPMHMRFEVMDVKNGYIRLTGSFEGHLEMCYWNLTNGHKLIAVYEESCGPLCQIEHFDFYAYDGRTYTPIAWYSIIPDIFGAFFTGDMDQQMMEMEAKDIPVSLLFELPRSGKNIIARMSHQSSQEDYKSYLYGDRMKLIWNGGFFSRGEIYWSAE